MEEVTKTARGNVLCIDTWTKQSVSFRLLYVTTCLLACHITPGNCFHSFVLSLFIPMVMSTHGYLPFCIFMVRQNLISDGEICRAIERKITQLIKRVMIWNKNIYIYIPIFGVKRSIFLSGEMITMWLCVTKNPYCFEIT